MPRMTRQRREPTDDWQQLRLLTQFPEQLTYELIRPVVLFGASPAERARQTGAPQRTLYRQVARFETEGMTSLFPPAPTAPKRTLPAEMRQAIRELKAEHPPFRPNELATICAARFGRRPSPHTVKRRLAEEPSLPSVRRRFPLYRDIAGAAERRLAIVRLHAEGWNVKSIAGYLGVDRHTVYATLRRWIDEGVLGLEDKSHARKPGIRTVDLRAMLAVRALQENPELGEFRIHAALKQLGIDLSPRTCGRILALNRALSGLPKPERSPREAKPMPFKAVRRHQQWTVDIRSLDHGVDDEKASCISVLENFSRSVLASAVSLRQDLTAYLMAPDAAIRQHGAPEALVSDGGAAVRAKQAQQVYERLGIVKLQIEPRQAWQSSIETQFNVQRRMADWRFARTTTWADLVAAHDRWVVDFNDQVHWAHREREDGRHSPAEVLAWVCCRQVAAEELHRIFSGTRFGRRLTRSGCLRFRHWRLYGERGLAGETAVVWQHGEQLTIAFADEALAQDTGSYGPDRRQLAAVAESRLFETPCRSPQLPLWERRTDEWLTVIRLAPYAPRRSRSLSAWQTPCLELLG